MAVTDPIADMLTRIRNAVKAKKPTVEVPASGLKKEIALILQHYNFIRKFVIVEDGKQGMMKILLSYNSGNSVIQGLDRVSTPGRRVYVSAKEMPKVLSGLGFAIVSTSHGVLTDHQCREKNVGGEVLCKVW
jgi:small subunit ribosomal protein S8